MKRFYIKSVGEHISIVHRPTHQVIEYGHLNEEGKKRIIQLAKMDTTEFYKEIHKLGFKYNTNKTLNEQLDEDKEKWYKGAWSYTTNSVLEHYKLKDIIPTEEMPIDLIKELQRVDRSSWGNSIVTPKEQSKKSVQEPKEEKPLKTIPKKAKSTPKKLDKKEGKEKEVKKDTKKEYKTRQDIRMALESGEITSSEYKKLMMKLLKKV